MKITRFGSDACSECLLVEYGEMVILCDIPLRFLSSGDECIASLPRGLLKALESRETVDFILVTHAHGLLGLPYLAGVISLTNTVVYATHPDIGIAVQGLRGYVELFAGRRRGGSCRSKKRRMNIMDENSLIVPPSSPSSPTIDLLECFVAAEVDDDRNLITRMPTSIACNDTELEEEKENGNVTFKNRVTFFSLNSVWENQVEAGKTVEAFFHHTTQNTTDDNFLPPNIRGVCFGEACVLDRGGMRLEAVAHPSGWSLSSCTWHLRCGDENGQNRHIWILGPSVSLNSVHSDHSNKVEKRSIPLIRPLETPVPFLPREVLLGSSTTTPFTSMEQRGVIVSFGELSKAQGLDICHTHVLESLEAGAGVILVLDLCLEIGFELIELLLQEIRQRVGTVTEATRVYCLGKQARHILQSYSTFLEFLSQERVQRAIQDKNYSAFLFEDFARTKQLMYFDDTESLLQQLGANHQHHPWLVFTCQTSEIVVESMITNLMKLLPEGLKHNSKNLLAVVNPFVEDQIMSSFFSNKRGRSSSHDNIVIAQQSKQKKSNASAIFKEAQSSCATTTSCFASDLCSEAVEIGNTTLLYEGQGQELSFFNDVFTMGSLAGGIKQSLSALKFLEILDDPMCFATRVNARICKSNDAAFVRVAPASEQSRFFADKVVFGTPTKNRIVQELQKQFGLTEAHIETTSNLSSYIIKIKHWNASFVLEDGCTWIEAAEESERKKLTDVLKAVLRVV